MDRSSILDDLGRAELSMVVAKRQIDEQYRVISELEEKGSDTEEAVELLKQFIEAQERHEQDRDRLLTRLAVTR